MLVEGKACLECLLLALTLESRVTGASHVPAITIDLHPGEHRREMPPVREWVASNGHEACKDGGGCLDPFSK